MIELPPQVLTSVIEDAAVFLGVVLVYGQLRERVGILPDGVREGVLGLFFGAAAILAMLVPVTVGPGVFIDGRYVLLGLSGPFGGVLAAVVAATVAGAYRVWLGGMGALAASTAIVVAGGASAFAAWLIERYDIDLRARHLLGLGLGIVALTRPCILFLLPDRDLALDVLKQGIFPVLLEVPLATLVLGLLMRQQTREGDLNRVFDAVIEHSTDCLLLAAVRSDDRFRLVRMNPSASAALGVSVDSVLGRTLPPNPPDPAMQRVLGRLRRGVAAGKPVRFEETEETQAGGRIWQVLGLPLRDRRGRLTHILASARDITHLKRAEAAARENEARYRLLADNATDAITRTTADGRRIYASPATREVFGYEPEELIEKSWRDLVHPDDLALIVEEARKLRQQETDRAVVTYRARQKSGRVIWVETSMRLARSAADPHADDLVNVVRDVTARKAVEEELARAKDLAEAASRAKSVFLANMSHELRTPLNAVIGFAELLQHECFGPLGDRRYLGYVGDIRVSGQHLLELINEVLDHAKAEAGGLALSDDLIEIAAIVGFAGRMLAPQAERAGVTVTTVVADGLHAVRGDERRLKQILLNLVTNAVKFTPAGGRITISAGLDDAGALAIEVADTGIGIAPTDWQRVLEPFGQAERGYSRGQEGTGLGLPLTKRLVELHGGTLELASVVGRGTSVTVRLPPERVVAATPEALAG